MPSYYRVEGLSMVAARYRGKLELPLLVDNGNAVPLTVSVDSPMTARVQIIPPRPKRGQVAEVRDLELFLSWRAQGLPIEAPGVRR